MTAERFAARIIEAGQREDADGFEFVLEVEGQDEPVHVPCTKPIARDAAAQLYQWFDVALTLTPRAAPRSE